MQKIARELNNSETAFIISSDSSEYDVHIRFFTPTNEVPICGGLSTFFYAINFYVNTEKLYLNKLIIN
jgi:PhzF family phenazine biosynthesis protein